MQQGPGCGQPPAAALPARPLAVPAPSHGSCPSRSNGSGQPRRLAALSGPELPLQPALGTAARLRRHRGRSSSTWKEPKPWGREEQQGGEEKQKAQERKEQGGYADVASGSREGALVNILQKHTEGQAKLPRTLSPSGERCPAPAALCAPGKGGERNGAEHLGDGEGTRGCCWSVHE